MGRTADRCVTVELGAHHEHPLAVLVHLSPLHESTRRVSMVRGGPGFKGGFKGDVLVFHLGVITTRRCPRGG